MSLVAMNNPLTDDLLLIRSCDSPCLDEEHLTLRAS